MKLEVKIDTDSVQKLERWTNSTLPQKRKELVRKLMDATLQNIINNTPVDTGRTQKAWSQAADSNGLSQAEGTSTSTQNQNTTAATATNSVPYVKYLEYGTASMAPFATVRTALLNIRQSIASFFEV